MAYDKNDTWTSDALLHGDIDSIRERVLEDPSYIRERDEDGNTPLLTAIEFVNLELVRFLLKHGADPNVRVRDGYTCLLTSIESEAEGSIQIVEELIRANADINAFGIHGWSPLHMAAARGLLEKASLLIGAGASVNLRKKIDAEETPLMEASWGGHPSTVSLLLENGADASMRDTMNKRNSLEIAKDVVAEPELGSDIIEVLEKGIQNLDVDTLFAGMDIPADQLDVIKQNLKNFDPAQENTDSSIQLSEPENHAEVIRILIEHEKKNRAQKTAPSELGAVFGNELD
ncbi:ankyrin repeat domain-containing protein [Verrucomicrobiales bacterium]|nr:ankyrin repeat domain-containing protein [Verrucomicrobiales bacterium]